MSSTLTNLLLATTALLSSVATGSPLVHEYPEQKPQHEHHGTSGCGKWHHGVDQLETIAIPSSSGREREFSVYLPASYDKHHPTAMFMSFHGRDTNTGEHAMISHFNDSRVNSDMIAVFPQAIDCLWQGTPHAKKDVSDKQFASDIIDHMRENYCIDNRRIYATGFDIGGGFVDSLACSPHHGGDFAAFSMVSPALFTEADGSWCKPERPLPILEIHGADDEVNCYDGGKTEDVPYISIPDFLKKWAERDGCNKTPDTCTKYNGLVHTTSYTCQGTEDFVQGIKIDFQKHWWPSTETNVHNAGVNSSIDASKKIIEFFKKHYNKHA